MTKRRQAGRPEFWRMGAVIADMRRCAAEELERGDGNNGLPEEWQRSAVTYWRPRRLDERGDADERAIELDRYWRNKYDASVLELLDLAPVAHAVQRDAVRGRIAAADRFAKLLRRYVRELRAKLTKPALAGRARVGNLAVLVHRERVSRAADPRSGRGRATIDIGTDVQGDAEQLLEHMQHLVEDKWPVLLAGAQRVRGTKATDVEWIAAAAAVRQWILEHLGRHDDADAVHALMFLGWDRLDGLAPAVQEERVREACRRHHGEPARCRHVAGFSRRRAGD